MEDLFNLCASDDLSLLALQKMLGSLPSSSNNNNDLHEYPFIHEACMNNKEVTFEIVDCLLQHFPNAANRSRLIQIFVAAQVMQRKISIATPLAN